MNSVHKFTDRTFGFCSQVMVFIVISLSLTDMLRAETFTITGTITRGSCVVDTQDKDILFAGLIETQKLKADTGDTTYTAPFTFRYSCSGFDTSSGQSVQMIKITPANGTRVSDDNKIFPDADLQNAGFILRHCGQDGTGCQVVRFSSSVAEISSVVTQNGELEVQFEASIVKISEQPAKSGDLVAAVDLTLLQP